MANSGIFEGSERDRSESPAVDRCPQCGATLLFASACPVCGAAGGGGAQILSYADAARARFAQTTVATPGRVVEPRAELESWNSQRSARAGGRRYGRLLVVAAVILVIALAAGLVATQIADHRSGPATSGPVLTPVQRFTASGLPFDASFPSTPSVSKVHLHLLSLPYVATQYTSSVGASTVSVGVYPFPLGKAGSFHAATVIRNFLASSAGASHPLAMTHLSTVQGLPAGDVAATTDGGTIASFGEIVLDGHIAYELLATGPASTVEATFHQAAQNFRIVSPALGWSF